MISIFPLHCLFASSVVWWCFGGRRPDQNSPQKASLPSPPFHRLLLCELLIVVSVLRNSRKTNFHFEGMSINNFGEIDKSQGLNFPPSPPYPYFFLMFNKKSELNVQGVTSWSFQNLITDHHLHLTLIMTSAQVFQKILSQENHPWEDQTSR